MSLGDSPLNEQDKLKLKKTLTSQLAQDRIDILSKKMLVETVSGELYDYDEITKNNTENVDKILLQIDTKDKIIGYRYLFNDKHMSALNISFNCWMCSEVGNALGAVYTNKKLLHCKAGMFQRNLSATKICYVAMRCDKFKLSQFSKTIIDFVLSDKCVETNDNYSINFQIKENNLCLK